jgi:hypothetical protein
MTECGRVVELVTELDRALGLRTRELTQHVEFEIPACN